MRRYSRTALAKAMVAILHTHSISSAVPALAELIISQKRVRELDLLIQDMGRALWQTSNHLEVAVSSAHPLSKTSLSHLKKLLQQATGATSVAANTSIDEQLIGGFIATTPAGVVDASLSTKLSILKTV